MKREFSGADLSGACAAIVACLFAVVAGVAVAATPSFPPFGLDESAWDPSIPPGQDFFQYVNGKWLAKTPIPADWPSVTIGRITGQRVEGQLHDIMERGAQKLSAAPPTDARGKVGAFYAAFMDEQRVEALGAKSIEPELAAIRQANTRSQLARLTGQGAGDFYGTLFSPSVDVDLKDTGHYAVYLNQPDLGMPDRDYYLKPEFQAQKAKYQAYVGDLLKLIGWPDAAAQAPKVVEFESKVAEVSWTKVQSRDLTKLYNPIAASGLAAFAPGFDWKAYLDGAGLSGKTKLVLAQNTAFPKITAVFAAAPIETLKAWLAFTVADNAAAYLSSPFEAARFEFRDKTLAGQVEERVRWKRAVSAVSGGDCGMTPRSCWGTLNWAVGQAYTSEHFTPETKASIQKLVANLMKAYRGRIERLDWMSAPTKQEALKKLDTYVVKVGYPDHERDYSKLVITRDDLVGDVRRAATADWAFLVQRSSGPVDRTDWLMSPQTVDAYNGPLRDIVFPAAILQPPMFDPAADDAVNYGAVGAVIGHELTHGFDDQGRHLDASGALRDWWAPEDAKKFDAKAKRLGAQYATYEPLPGLHINPDLTMGENIADLGGVTIALDAYHASLGSKPAPVLDKLTGDQRFFLSWAQVWRGKMREDAIRQITVSDPHSFRKYRVNGVVRNVDGWYASFPVEQNMGMYCPPVERIRIW